MRIEYQGKRSSRENMETLVMKLSAIVSFGLLTVATACGNNSGSESMSSSAPASTTSSATATTESVSAHHSAILQMDMPSDFTLYQTDTGPQTERWSFTYSTRTGWNSPVPGLIATVDKSLTSRGYMRCGGNMSTSGQWADGTGEVSIGYSLGLVSGTSAPAYLSVIRNTAIPKCP